MYSATALFIYFPSHVFVSYFPCCLAAFLSFSLELQEKNTIV